jgi:hypothetical protein
MCFSCVFFLCFFLVFFSFSSLGFFSFPVIMKRKHEDGKRDPTETSNSSVFHETNVIREPLPPPSDPSAMPKPVNLMGVLYPDCCEKIKLEWDVAYRVLEFTQSDHLYRLVRHLLWDIVGDSPKRCGHYDYDKDYFIALHDLLGLRDPRNHWMARLLYQVAEDHPHAFYRRVGIHPSGFIHQLCKYAKQNEDDKLRQWLQHPVAPASIQWESADTLPMFTSSGRALELMLKFGIVPVDYTPSGTPQTLGIERARDSYEEILKAVLLRWFAVDGLCETVVSFLTPTAKERARETKMDNEYALWTAY